MTLVALFQPVMDAVGLPLYLGAQHLTAHHRPPRVVWVPMTGAFEGAVSRGGPRAIGNERARFDAHCWGRNFDEALELRRRVAWQLRAVLGDEQTAVRHESSEWVARETGAQTLAGEVYVLTISLLIPLTDEQWISVDPLPEEHAVPDTAPTDTAIEPNPDAAADDGVLDALES